MEYYTRTDNQACASPKDMRTLSEAKRSCPERCGLVQAEGHSDEWHGWKPCACLRAWRSFPPLPRPQHSAGSFRRQAGKGSQSLQRAAQSSVGRCCGGSSRVHGGPQAASPWEGVWTGLGRWSRPLPPHPSPISKEQPWSWRYEVPPPLPDLETASHLPNFSSERLGL